MPRCIACSCDKAQELFAKRGNGWRGECKECHNARSKQWAHANSERRADQTHRSYAKGIGKDPEECRKIRRTPDELKAKKRLDHARHYAANRERYIESARQSVLRRTDEVAEYQRQWREANAERKRLNDKLWRRSNAGRVAWHSGKRKKAERRAAPAWLTQEHWEEIQVFYDRAVALSEQTGVQYHVDHIEPIQGKHSCGLHVPWNLQVLPASVNRAKGNRLVAA